MLQSLRVREAHFKTFAERKKAANSIFAGQTQIFNLPLCKALSCWSMTQGRLRVDELEKWWVSAGRSDTGYDSVSYVGVIFHRGRLAAVISLSCAVP